MAIATIGYRGTGRRKTASARVRLVQGSGKITVNGNPLEKQLPRATLQKTVVQPLELTNTLSKYDVLVNATGGGVNGQAGAIRLGIARALLQADPELRGTLKKALMLRRDPRARERKKYGQKGARKRFQYSKR